MDGEEISRNYESLRIVGDARLSLEELATRLLACDLGKRRSVRESLVSEISDAFSKYDSVSDAIRRSPSTPAKPERLMSDLEHILTPDDIVVADASYSTAWVTTCLTAKRPGMRFLTPRGLAGLGWGFPMALGAKLAKPDSRVFCVTGDGGFGHCWQELETAVRTGIDVIVTVLNNGILGYQKDAEDVKFGRHTDAIYFKPVDHAAIAEACGCLGIRVDDPTDYVEALNAGLNSHRPTVIDVQTDPSAYPPVTLFDSKLEEFRAVHSEICRS